MSEHKIICINSKYLIICFGGMFLQMGGILPFEFLTYLSKTYIGVADLYFFVDKKQCWYHLGIDGITNNINDTVIYLNNIIKKKLYEKIIFMGVSAGGYASILFGSLCDVTDVISYIPITTYAGGMNDSRYYNLKHIINNTTNYILNGDLNIKNVNNIHHISQCDNIDNFNNVKVIKHGTLNMKILRDDGTIKSQIDSILQITN
jgi:hypothetical protein